MTLRGVTARPAFLKERASPCRGLCLPMASGQLPTKASHAVVYQTGVPQRPLEELGVEVFQLCLGGFVSGML